MTTWQWQCDTFRSYFMLSLNRKAYDSVKNIIHLGWRPPSFWGPMLKPAKSIGKSGTAYDIYIAFGDISIDSTVKKKKLYKKQRSLTLLWQELWKAPRPWSTGVLKPLEVFVLCQGPLKHCYFAKSLSKGLYEIPWSPFEQPTPHPSFGWKSIYQKHLLGTEWNVMGMGSEVKIWKNFSVMNYIKCLDLQKKLTTIT